MGTRKLTFQLPGVFLLYSRESKNIRNPLSAWDRWCPRFSVFGIHSAQRHHHDKNVMWCDRKEFLKKTLLSSVWETWANQGPLVTPRCPNRTLSSPFSFSQALRCICLPRTTSCRRQALQAEFSPVGNQVQPAWFSIALTVVSLLVLKEKKKQKPKNKGRGSLHLNSILMLSSFLDSGIRNVLNKTSSSDLCTHCRQQPSRDTFTCSVGRG